jgi:2,3-bisphosphoglycerate-dependent phosphoglycerate mutase
MRELALTVVALLAVACHEAKPQPLPAAEGPSIVAGASPPTVVYLTRHAEKALRGPNDEDPPLSAKGRARAKALAERLKETGIAAIYVTQFRRTQETAAELARLRSLSPQVVPAGATRKLVDEILQHHRGGRVLVVGHSDTLPELIAALGVLTPIVMDERRYGDLFVVTRPMSGAAWVEEEHVGD